MAHGSITRNWDNCPSSHVTFIDVNQIEISKKKKENKNHLLIGQPAAHTKNAIKFYFANGKKREKSRKTQNVLCLSDGIALEIIKRRTTDVDSQFQLFTFGTVDVERLSTAINTIRWKVNAIFVENTNTPFWRCMQSTAYTHVQRTRPIQQKFQCNLITALPAQNFPPSSHYLSLAHFSSHVESNGTIYYLSWIEYQSKMSSEKA